MGLNLLILYFLKKKKKSDMSTVAKAILTENDGQKDWSSQIPVESLSAAVVSQFFI